MGLDWLLEKDQSAYNLDLEGKLHVIAYITGMIRCGHAGKKRKEQMLKMYDRPLGRMRGFGSNLIVMLLLERVSELHGG